MSEDMTPSDGVVSLMMSVLIDDWPDIDIPLVGVDEVYSNKDRVESIDDFVSTSI
jgi:hypothetical protein